MRSNANGSYRTTRACCDRKHRTAEGVRNPRQSCVVFSSTGPVQRVTEGPVPFVRALPSLVILPRKHDPPEGYTRRKGRVLQKPRDPGSREKAQVFPWILPDAQVFRQKPKCTISPEGGFHPGVHRHFRPQGSRGLEVKHKLSLLLPRFPRFRPRAAITGQGLSSA